MNNIIYHIIYKTINSINKNTYIGVHSTTDLFDNYLGSGTLIKYAIKKYGKENFYREILFIFKNRQDALNKESEIVSKEFLSKQKTYNIQPGGSGGNNNMVTVYNPNEPNKYFNVFKDDPRYINKELLHNATGRKHKENSKKKIGEKHKNKKFSLHTKKLISEKNCKQAVLKNIKTGEIKKVYINSEIYLSKDWVGLNKNIKISDEAKRKMSLSNKRPYTEERKRKLSESKKGKIIVRYKDKLNEKGFLINKNDDRLKTGELIPVNTLSKRE